MGDDAKNKGQQQRNAGPTIDAEWQQYNELMGCLNSGKIRNHQDKGLWKTRKDEKFLVAGIREEITKKTNPEGKGKTRKDEKFSVLHAAERGDARTVSGVVAGVPPCLCHRKRWLAYSVHLLTNFSLLWVQNLFLSQGCWHIESIC
ncbi:hypothetical protein HanRHA438_Chr04g0161431 [Helianthus annuus]|nr:hypothetical protein HanHA300_Chr04g0124691 [Helianthus annuus]KAJ0595955.1 hypothetical protein HanHA89_Chr04g0137211 [Helianthus annuus]KAJ0925594.1 hypothetical protein HanRHA438_Chr04g0161431 [Helianthus annuus]